MPVKSELYTLSTYLSDLTQKEKGLEFYLLSEENYSLDFKDRALYLEDYSKELSLAIRYLNEKGKTGILYVTNPELARVKQAVEHVKSLAEFGQEGVFPDLPIEYPSLHKKRSEKPSRESLLMILEEGRDALAKFRKISRVEREIISWSCSEISLIRDGRVLSEELRCFHYALSCIAKGDEKEASSYISTEALSPEGLKVRDLASWCAFKAEALSETHKGGSIKCSVLFPPEHAIELLGILAFSLNGEEVLKRRSKLADALEKKLFSEGLTIIDDGVNPELVESRAFDDEGVPQQRTVLIERGYVKNFIWNSLSAFKAGVSSTGNARRPDLASPPRVDFTNLYITPGSFEREILIQRERQVFMVLELLGVHTADPISGDFSFGASGILYENGEPVSYLAEMALSGNIFDMFREVEVGKDLTFFGSLGTPSLLFPPMSLG